jgi:superfamily I DNA/RNA helicase
MRFALSLAGNPKIDVPAVIRAVSLAGKVENPHATLTTAHSGKGGEWGQVVLGNDYRAINEEDEVNIDEGMILYVGVTRAKNSLVLSDSAKLAIEKGREKGASADAGR